MLMILGPFTLTQALLALFTAFSVGFAVKRTHAEPSDPETEYRKLEERLRHPWKHYAKHQ
jgi:hypothetical protein